MKLKLLKFFLIAYAFFFVSQNLNLGWADSLTKSVPVFELFGMFYDSLPQKVHQMILTLGLIVVTFTAFKLFRKVTAVLVKILSVVLLLVFVGFLFFAGRFFYDNPKTARMVYEYVMRRFDGMAQRD